MIKDPLYISIADAAAQYGVSQRTVRRWIASGRLAGYKFGPALIRVRRTDVDALHTRIPTVVRSVG